jgi:hypothetical protein
MIVKCAMRGVMFPVGLPSMINLHLMEPSRYLTKSLFKLAVECPTKLYYSGKQAEYADASLDDPFLHAMADGGFQIGALARCYIPGGHDIGKLGLDEALAETERLLQAEQVVLYEPAFRYGNLFIRVDILVKQGSRLHLVEVKSKAAGSGDKEKFTGSQGRISTAWKPYLYDVAFQTYVLRHAMPSFEVSPFLMIVDSSAECPTDGLSGKFRIRRNALTGKAEISGQDIMPRDLSVPLLKTLPVDEHIAAIMDGSGTDDFRPLGFEETITLFAGYYCRDERMVTLPGSKCRECRFFCSSVQKASGLKSGFEECWKTAFGWDEEDFAQPSVLDLWDFRNRDRAIAEGKTKITDLGEDDLGMKTDCRPGLSRTERQLLQITKVRNADSSPYVDSRNLADTMRQWTFPLHFIDFETAMPPIPFTKGRHPYETLAFQFSHHVVTADCTVSHAGQFLADKPGMFPNYDFLRTLSKELGNDDGTILRYGSYENSVLRSLYRQLAGDKAPPADRDELLEFISSITVESAGNGEDRKGSRSMVDMLELVKRYYYDPGSGGSNSIKSVLPALLNSSGYLRERYGRPLYGIGLEVRSLNFEKQQWVQPDSEGRVRDPYALLPNMFTDIDETALSALLGDIEDNAIRHGGSAMTAYARLQYEDMSGYERTQICNALRKYCELDTFAMVMIYEGWREMVRR